MKYIFLAIALCFQFGKGFSQNLFDKEHSLTYANYLFENGLYKLASTELERLNFQFPAEDNLQFLLLKSYRKSFDFKRGLLRANELFTNPETIHQLTANEYFKLLILNGKSTEANTFIATNLSLKQTTKTAFKLHLTLLNKNWQDADLQYKNAQNKQNLVCYKPLIDEGLNITYKKPFLAGTFSAIVPGSGKMYTGFWRDGFLSLFSIGVSGWQAYTGFDKDGQNSAYGWTFASLTSILYLANIYGSVKSAKHINSFNEEKVLHKVQHCLDD